MTAARCKPAVAYTESSLIAIQPIRSGNCTVQISSPDASHFVSRPFHPPAIMLFCESIESAETGSPRVRLIQHAPVMFMLHDVKLGMIIKMGGCVISHQLITLLGLVMVKVKTNATKLNKHAE